MGCYRSCCRPTPVNDGLSKVLLFLVVILILLSIPKLFTREPPPVIVEPPKESINWPLIFLPLLLLAIVLGLSSMGSPDYKCCPMPPTPPPPLPWKPPPPPPCKRYRHCSCKGSVPWGVAH